MFSVIIPLYNKELSVTETLRSVLNQTFTDFEIVIVNDGSTDNSLEIVSKIKDPRITLVNKENGGVSSARNRGIQVAKRDWIVFLDGDDIWFPNHLETLAEMIGRFSLDKVFCTAYIKSGKKNKEKRS